MTDFDDATWFHYFQDEERVLVSPALARRDDPDWSLCCASALARPALGCLPPQARYILARDGTLRLECVGGDPSEAKAILEAEREAWNGPRLSGEDLAEWIREVDGDSGQTAFELEREWEAIAAVSRIVAATPQLAGSFVADSLAPWGVFRLEDEEIITVEAVAGRDFLRFDRALDLPIPNDDMTLQLVEWLLQINTASVIGPRCSIELEPDTGLPLLGLSLAPGALDAPMLLGALSELHARACGIEERWLRMSGQSAAPTEMNSSAEWLRA